jgi:chorismate mutase
VLVTAMPLGKRVGDKTPTLQGDLSTNLLEPMSGVCALRGATTIASDEAAAVLGATEELLRALMERNALSSDDIISVLFTATPDVTAEFPAVAARRIGLSNVPLMCAVEMNVPGAVPRCIRVLMHVGSQRDRNELEDVYLHEARTLRTPPDE